MTQTETVRAILEIPARVNVQGIVEGKSLLMRRLRVDEIMQALDSADESMHRRMREVLARVEHDAGEDKNRVTIDRQMARARGLTTGQVIAAIGPTIYQIFGGILYHVDEGAALRETTDSLGPEAVSQMDLVDFTAVVETFVAIHADAIAAFDRLFERLEPLLASKGSSKSGSTSSSAPGTGSEKSADSASPRSVPSLKPPPHGGKKS